MGWIAADDSTRGTWLKSANHNSSDYNRESDEGSEDSISSLSDSSCRRGSLASKESELMSKETVEIVEIVESKEEPDVPEPVEIIDELVPPSEEEISHFSKKKGKKSKFAAKRAMFAETCS